MTHSEILRQMLEPGLIPVIRTGTPDDVPAICEALMAGGANCLEITLTIPGALGCIREASRRYAARAITGAGSVMTAEQCRAAMDAGARFIVTPIMRPEIAKMAKAAGLPVILGALTPTEAQLAWEAGADLVKIFPADSPGFIKSILAPLPQLKVIATSGVTLRNAPDFLAAGCVALGAATALMTPEILSQRNWPELTRQTREFVETIRRCRPR